MGHHIFVLGKKSLVMNDASVELLRHFLVQAAIELKADTVREVVQRWERWGSGVWGHIKEEDLIGKPDLFNQAIACVNRFEPEIPVDYLNRAIDGGGTWGKAVSCSDLTAQLKKLEDLLAQRPKPWWRFW